MNYYIAYNCYTLGVEPAYFILRRCRPHVSSLRFGNRIWGNWRVWVISKQEYDKYRETKIYQWHDVTYNLIHETSQIEIAF